MFLDADVVLSHIEASSKSGQLCSDAEPETFETFEDAFLDAPFRSEEPERARAAGPDTAAANGVMADLGLDTTPEQLPLPEDGTVHPLQPELCISTDILRRVMPRT